MSKPIVFLSYSHDSDAHGKRVLALSQRLRGDGVETILDQYHKRGTPEDGWPRWMLNSLDQATQVLVVCSETYYRRFRGREVPGLGKGADWEGALITRELYEARQRSHKFIPVVFTASDDEFIPEPLRAQTHYLLDREANYRALYDALLGQAGVEPAPLGELQRRPRSNGPPLTFADSPPDASSSSLALPNDVARILRYAPERLIGRDDELAILSAAWDRVARGEVPRPHVLSFVALGGEGKTSLVASWAVDLAHRGWPDCEAAFAWSFYSQGTREQVAASSDLFLRAALLAFGDAAMADSNQGAFEKGRRLAQLIGARRALLILDGVEPLQYPPTAPTPGLLKDQGVAALLQGLASASRGLCVLTTRYALSDLRAFVATTAPEHVLTRLSSAAGEALLRALGVRGNRREYADLVEAVRGHALTLNLLGNYLHDAHAGDIRRRDRVPLAEADAEGQNGHAFRVMAAYARWFVDDGEKGARALALLRLLGLFDRPAGADCLAALLAAPAIAGLTESLVALDEAPLNVSLSRLAAAKLLSVHRDDAGTLISLDAHPLLREYLAGQLRDTQPEAWRAAHRRLYEHLCASTPDLPEAKLEDLQPLYQAVAHGCLAGLQEEALYKVYVDRILRGTDSGGFYSTKKLGALASDLGAVACFFERPWQHVSPALNEADQAWLLNEAATRLRALGRLSEALAPIRTALGRALGEEHWKYAAVGANNLAQIELALGEVLASVSDSELSTKHADRSGNTEIRMVFRTTHGHSLHQAGRGAEAEARFREAEALQAKSQPAYPLLYSFQGFLYCDLLLAPAEQAAWRLTLAGGERSAAGNGQFPEAAALREVAKRAAKTLHWLTNHFTNASLLDIALDHLTMARSTLYQAILTGASPAAGREPLAQAVAGLRRAGQLDYLPLGLLTRAWYLFLTDQRNPGDAAADPTSADCAQADLDEAWEISARGPMPLFLVDIHLTRARLFGPSALATGADRYPWTSPAADLAVARRLIEKHGYGRRREELEDAERVLLGAPS